MSSQVAPTPVAPVSLPGPRAATLPQARLEPARLVVLVVMVFPVYWMVSTAFKPGHDILSYTPKWFPTPSDACRTSATRSTSAFFWNAVKNSLIVVSVVVALSLVLAFLAALALAKFRFYGRKAFI